MAEPELPATPADPEAPWGRRPDGTPYRRDPGPFAHLRRAQTRKRGHTVSDPKPPTKRPAITAGKPAAAKRTPLSAEPPKDTAEGYGKRITGWFRNAAKFGARRAPVPAAIVAVRAPSMGEAWGKVAVSYPKVGRAIDKIGKGGDLSEALGSTLLTAAMVAHSMGLTRGTPIGDLIEEALLEVLAEYMSSDAFDTMRERTGAIVVTATVGEPSADATP